MMRVMRQSLQEWGGRGSRRRAGQRRRAGATRLQAFELLATVQRESGAEPAEVARAWAAAARALTDAGRIKRATEAFREALAATPDDAELHARLSGHLALLGRSSEALEHAELGHRLAPSTPEALAAVARSLLVVGRPAEALEVANKLTGARPDVADGWIYRGIALLSRGSVHEAVEAL